MVCRAGQTCLIQFNLLYGSQNKTLTPDRYPLCESTRGKDLYDYIEEHCQIQANRFKLYLSSAGKLVSNYIFFHFSLLLIILFVYKLIMFQLIIRLTYLE